jgi:hypothetical protein
MDSDEVVCVSRGLRAGEQPLPGVLLQVGDHPRRDLGAPLSFGELRLGREVDLLPGELVVDDGVHEAPAPEQQTSGHEQDDDEDGTARAGENVEHSAETLLGSFDR